MKAIKTLLFMVCFMLLVSVLFADTLDWIIYIKSGQKFTIVFDKMRGKRDKRSKRDPWDDLRVEDDYEVVYRDGAYFVTGYHSKKKKRDTWSDSSADPLDNQISLWGRLFVFDGKGNLYDTENGLVGHLERH